MTRLSSSSDTTARHQHGRSEQTSTTTSFYRQLLMTLSDGQLPVCGLSVVADRLYVCRSHSPYVEVYDAATTTYRRLHGSSIHVPGMSGPSDMVGDTAGGATLYIGAENDGAMFKVTLRSGEQVRWTPDDRPYGVSLTTTTDGSSRHLLVLSRQAACVSMLDADDGRPLRRLRLPASVASPWAAVHVPAVCDEARPVRTGGDLIVCHGGGHLTSDCRGVSRLDWWTGTVTRRYHWLSSGPRSRSTASAMHMVPESDGALLVADQCADSVQRVDVNLTSHTSLLADTGHHDSSDVEQPHRLCVDRARRRLIVGLDDGRVKVFANGCVVM